MYTVYFIYITNLFAVIRGLISELDIFYCFYFKGWNTGLGCTKPNDS